MICPLYLSIAFLCLFGVLLVSLLLAVVQKCLKVLLSCQRRNLFLFSFKQLFIMSSRLPPPAGLNGRGKGETTSDCLNFVSRPLTPDNVRKYRKSYFAEPGQRVIHPGLLDHVKTVDPMKKFGVTTALGDHVEGILGNKNKSDYELLKEERNERHFSSSKREPLGKSYNRGHCLPEHCKNPNYQFGAVSALSESSKSLIYPYVVEDDALYNELYKKSHGSSLPGEQKDRNYNWDQIQVNPKMHIFGEKPKGNTIDSASSCLCPEFDNGVLKTTITSKKVEDMRCAFDRIGEVRRLGCQTSQVISNDRTFGVSTKNRDEWDAYQCIQGNYSEEEQRPDADIGKSVVPGSRNDKSDLRTYGIPSIRTDIVPSSKRSIADNQNYGDDINAQYLLYPDQFAFRGISDQEFIRMRDKTEVRMLFETIGYKLQDEEFHFIWNKATGGNEIGSIEQMRSVLNEYLDYSLSSS